MNKVVLGIGALLLAGCATGAPAPVVTVTETAGVDSEAEFLYDVEQFVPGLTSNAEQEAITVGRAICTALAEGSSMLELSGDITSAGFTGFEAEVIISASIVNFCPQYMEVS